MHAATQHTEGTMRAAAAATRRPPPPTPAGPHAVLQPMSATPPRQFVIRGQTVDGKAFRPSDWAERLAGAMSSFRPAVAGAGISAYIGYSPYCVPQLDGSVKCVLVSEALQGLEPMAWDFVMNFARDNQLQVQELPAALHDAPLQ